MIDKKVLVKVCADVAAAGKKYYQRLSFIAAMTAVLRKQAQYADVRVADVGAAVSAHALSLPLALPPSAVGKTGTALARELRRTARQADPERRLHYKQLRRRVPEKYLPLVTKAENGSRTAACKLTCLDCANYVVSEIRHCALAGTCPMWGIRPFQPKTKTN